MSVIRIIRNTFNSDLDIKNIRRNVHPDRFMLEFIYRVASVENFESSLSLPWYRTWARQFYELLGYLICLQDTCSYNIGEHREKIFK